MKLFANMKTETSTKRIYVVIVRIFSVNNVH